MKEIILIATILFLIPTFVYGLVSCPVCSTTFCSCTITDCSSGKLFVYTSSSCSGVPSDKPSFPSGYVTWYPTAGGTLYVKPFCDDPSITTQCSSVSVEGPTTSTTTPVTTTTTTSKPLGDGGGCHKVGHVCTAFSVCCPELVCVEGICQSPLSIGTTTTTTPIPIVAKEDCPYECCQGEENFHDSYCSEGFECVENNCQEIIATPPSEEGTQLSWWLILPVYLLIVVALLFILLFVLKFPWGIVLPIILVVAVVLLVVLFLVFRLAWEIVLPLVLLAVIIPLFIFFFIFKRKQDDWKNLYEKWKKPRHPSYR